MMRRRGRYRCESRLVLLLECDRSPVMIDLKTASSLRSRSVASMVMLTSLPYIWIKLKRLPKWSGRTLETLLKPTMVISPFAEDVFAVAPQPVKKSPPAELWSSE